MKQFLNDYYQKFDEIGMDLVGIKNIYISAHFRLDEVGHIRLYVDGVLKVVVAFGRNLQLNQLIRLQIEKDEALFVCLAFVSAAHRLLIEPGVPSGNWHGEISRVELLLNHEKSNKHMMYTNRLLSFS